MAQTLYIQISYDTKLYIKFSYDIKIHIRTQLPKIPEGVHFSTFPSKGNTQLLIPMNYCVYVTLQGARQEASHEFRCVTDSSRHCQQICRTSNSAK